MSALINFEQQTLTITPDWDAVARRVAAAETQEALVARASRKIAVEVEKIGALDAAEQWMLEAADLMAQVASMLDKWPRIRMITRNEGHIEISDSAARHMAGTLRTLAMRVDRHV
jgi:hypothetical protein